MLNTAETIVADVVAATASLSTAEVAAALGAVTFGVGGLVVTRILERRRSAPRRPMMLIRKRYAFTGKPTPELPDAA